MLGILLVGGVAALAGSGGDDSATSDERAPTPRRAAAEGTQPPTSTADLPAHRAAHRLDVASVDASSVLEPERVRCTGDVVTYDAGNAVDGSAQTAWATAEPDGTGQSITVTFPKAVHVTEVGLIPGYAKVGPTTASGCQSHSRFLENRVISSVEYAFDGGEMLTQTFAMEPVLQTSAASVDTTSVVVTITGTQLPPGDDVDDNTVISEIHLLGYEVS